MNGGMSLDVNYGDWYRLQAVTHLYSGRGLRVQRAGRVRLSICIEAATNMILANYLTFLGTMTEEMIGWLHLSILLTGMIMANPVRVAGLLLLPPPLLLVSSHLSNSMWFSGKILFLFADVLFLTSCYSLN